MEQPHIRLLRIPPPFSPDEDLESPPESILLDPHGYISARENDSTAHGSTRDECLIKVTFWPVRPPRVSCFTVSPPDMDEAFVPSAFGDLPMVLSTEEDLVLFRVAIFPNGDDSSGGAEVDPKKFEYFVYQAGDMKKGPSLHPIPLPPILEFYSSKPVLLRRPGRGEFFIAILCRRRFDREQFDIHLYNSKAGKWSTKKMCSSQEMFEYSYASKAITIGGEHGSVGWVDLWHGILIYDVLLDTNYFRYIPLPSPNRLNGNPRLTRDIAVVNGCIKFFDMHPYMKLANIGYNTYTYVPDGWDAATWKLNVSKKASKWEDDYKINIAEVPLKDAAYALVPIQPSNLDEGEDTEPSLMRLYACYPALSLHDDGVVHIMNKLEPSDNMACMISVDMKNKTLKGVASFDNGRPVGYGFTFLESGISKHLGICSSRYRHSDEGIFIGAGTSRNVMIQSGNEVPQKDVQPQHNAKGTRRRS